MDLKFLNAHGVYLYGNKDLTGAMRHFETAANFDRDDPTLPFNAGRCAMDMRAWFDAVMWNERALAIKPDYVDAMCNIAVSFLWLGSPESALHWAEKAVELKPDFANSHSALGFAKMHAGDLPGAQEAWRKALEINPVFPEAAFNLAATQLQQMDFSAGSPEFYKWRTQHDPVAFSGMPAPLTTPWKGETLEGKSIILWGEQGLGDQILFAGMAPEIIAAAAKVLIVCDDRLVSLFARSFPGAAIIGMEMRGQIDPKTYDFQCPLGALPAYCRRSRESFAGSRPYLVPDVRRVIAMRERFNAVSLGDPLVGASWASESRYGWFKSTDLVEHWGAITRRKDIQLISVQYGPTRDEGRGVMPVPRDVYGDDLEMWAAQIAAMDSIVTVSNTTAHIAGAMGIPCHVMVPRGAGRLWYWFDMPKAEDGSMQCLWYPSLKLYAQNKPGVWEDVIGNIARAL